MADSLTFQLEGWDALVASLDGPIADKLANPKEAELAAAQVIARLIRTRAPRRTGRLAGSFGARFEGQGAIAYSELVYSGVINYGWPAHNIAPHHYVESATASSEDEVRVAFEEWLADVMAEMEGA